MVESLWLPGRITLLPHPLITQPIYAWLHPAFCQANMGIPDFSHCTSLLVVPYEIIALCIYLLCSRWGIFRHFLQFSSRYLTGMVEKRTLEKYEKEAKEKNRETWWALFALEKFLSIWLRSSIFIRYNVRVQLGDNGNCSLICAGLLSVVIYISHFFVKTNCINAVAFVFNFSMNEQIHS